MWQWWFAYELKFMPKGEVSFVHLKPWLATFSFVGGYVIIQKNKSTKINYDLVVHVYKKLEHSNWIYKVL